MPSTAKFNTSYGTANNNKKFCTAVLEKSIHHIMFSAKMGL